MKNKDMQILNFNNNFNKDLKEELLDIEEFKMEMINFLLFPYSTLKEKGEVAKKVTDFFVKLGCNLFKFVPVVGDFISETIKDTASLALNEKNKTKQTEMIDKCINEYNKNNNGNKIPTLKEKYNNLQIKYKNSFDINSKEFNSVKDKVLNNRETLLEERQNNKIKNLENVQQENNSELKNLQKKYKEQTEKLKEQEERLKKIEELLLYTKANNDFEKINIREDNDRLNNL